MHPACFQGWIIYKARACVNDYFLQLPKTERDGPDLAHPVRLAGWGRKLTRPFPALITSTSVHSESGIPAHPLESGVDGRSAGALGSRQSTAADTVVDGRNA